MDGPFCKTLILTAVACTAWPVIATAADDDTPVDFNSQLPRIAPVEPADAVDTFRTIEGIDVRLVAAESLVVDPIAMAFDEYGRLYIVEMRGCSENPDEHLGRIRLLTDTDDETVLRNARQKLLQQ